MRSIYKIVIPDYKLPSWNTFYSGLTHWGRQALAKEAHELVMASLLGGQEVIKGLADIKVTAYYKHKRRRDSDNVCSKLIIDGLKGRVIEDDDTRYVRNVTTRAVIGAKEDKVVVEIITLST